jgi:hypothetical protein
VNVPRGRWLPAAVVAAIALAIVVVAHKPLIRFLISRGASLATGYTIRFGDYRLGREHAAFADVHVTKNGDPFFDARRVDVSYQLRDIFPGGAHRFGFAAIAVDRPVFTLLRHADGSFVFSGGAAAHATPPQATKRASEPLYFSVRVRDGTIRLVDARPVAADLAEQEIDGVAIDASIKSDARTTARIAGTFVSRRTQGAPLGHYPIAIRSVIDDTRGFAIHRVRAAALPLRGLVDFFVHTPAFRVDDGMVRDIDVRAYALEVAPNAPVDYHLGGSARVADGRFAIAPLIVPARAVGGRVGIYDDGITFAHITGTAGGVPLRAQGGLFGWNDLGFRIGLVADADLAQLRRLFAFSRPLALGGPMHLETLIGGKVAKPVISVAFSSPQIRYSGIPFGRASGRIAYYDEAVLLQNLRATYGGVQASLEGRLLTGGSTVDTLVALAAHARGSAVPYAATVAPDSNLDIVGLLSGDARGYVLRGTLGTQGPTDGSGFFRIDQRGDGEIGPFAFRRRDGSSFYGALRYERSSSQSGGWLSVDRFRLANVATPPRFPNVTLPQLPPLAGVLDGNLVGGGSPSSFALAGRIRLRDAVVVGLPLGDADAQLGGTLASFALARIRVRGPLGGFTGGGSIENGIVAITGDYDGSFEELRPATGIADARGAVRGPVKLIVADDRITVQSNGATFTNAHFYGVSLERAAGTIALERGRVHVIAADAAIGGAAVVAKEEQGGAVAISAPAIPAAALAGTGLPLASGALSVFGDARLDRRFGFAGTVIVARGRAAGYPVSGDANLDVALPAVRIRGGTGALGRTFGTFDGRIDGVGSPSLRYDLDARVALGDLRLLRRDLRLPVRHLNGSFSARLHVRGNAAGPAVSGPVSLPEFSYNGLHVTGARALLVIAHGTIAARHGSFTVGSTHADIDGSYTNASTFDLALHAPTANLADFDDFFDDAGVLAGTGSLALSLRDDGTRLRAAGAAAIDGLRIRSLPLGTTRVDLAMHGAAIGAVAAADGPAGRIAAHADVIPAAGPIGAALAHAQYDGGATVAGVQLGTWLPALGLAYPVQGTLGGSATIDGRAPSLGIGGDLALTNGSIAGFKIARAEAHAAARNGGLEVRSASADLGFVQLDAHGSLGLAAPGPLALDVHATAPDLGVAVHALAPQTRGVDLAGAFESTAELRGTLAAPRLIAGFDVRNGRFNAVAVPHVLGEATLDGTAFTLQNADVAFAHGSASVSGEVPLNLAPFALGPRGSPVSAELTATDVDLAAFGPLFPAGTRTGGTLRGRIGIEGTVGRPQLYGSLSLSSGSYVSNIERAPVKNVNASLTFAQSSVALEAFHAGLGGGTLDGSGRLDLPFAQTPAVGYAVKLVAKKADFDFPAYGKGQVDGNLSVSSGRAIPIVTGSVALSNATIPFATLYSAAAGGGAATEGPPFDLDFDLTARAGQNVRVRSSIIDIGATGELQLTGRLSAPRLAGTITSTGGTFTTYNHAFRVQRGVVHFVAADGVVPTLDLVATAHVYNPDPDPTRNIAGSANITITVTGPADGFKVTYASNPAYSEAQIAALLLDVPALLGGVNFNTLNGTIAGAPGETNVLLPPGVTPEQTGVISFSDEVFSFANTALTQHALSPVESIFQRIFGLSDFGLLLDRTGGVGISARRQLGQRDFYAVVNETLSYPQRSSFGLELRPDEFTAASLTYYHQIGVAYLLTNQIQSESGLFATSREVGVQPFGNRSGINFALTRRYP